MDSWPGRTAGAAENAPGAASRGSIFLAPSTPAIAACSLVCALEAFKVKRLAILSSSGLGARPPRCGGTFRTNDQLLSLQSIPQEVFDTQVAFNMLDRWGEGSAQRLSDVRSDIVVEVRTYLMSAHLFPRST